MEKFERELSSAINRCSQENASNTPDFILAQYLGGCLAAFNQAVQQRETWYGRDGRPSTKPTVHDLEKMLNEPAGDVVVTPNGEVMATRGATPAKYGTDLILEEIHRERQRQVVIEGYFREHDDAHGDGELAQAGAAYAMAWTGRNVAVLAKELWPWETASWKPKNPRWDLIRAAALIVAEIERLDRASNSGDG